MVMLNWWLNEKLLNEVSYMIDETKSQIGLAEHVVVLASGLLMQTIYNNQLQAQ
jgi:hypothetical protein